jgi:hypothetical protein
MKYESERRKSENEKGCEGRGMNRKWACHAERVCRVAKAYHVTSGEAA